MLYSLSTKFNRARICEELLNLSDERLRTYSPEKWKQDNSKLSSPRTEGAWFSLNIIMLVDLTSNFYEWTKWMRLRKFRVEGGRNYLMNNIFFSRVMSLSRRVISNNYVIWPDFQILLSFKETKVKKFENGRRGLRNYWICINEIYFSPCELWRTSEARSNNFI